MKKVHLERCNSRQEGVTSTVHEWSYEEVCLWLLSTGGEKLKLINKFYHNQVNGTQLLAMTADDLVAWGYDNLADVKCLLWWRDYIAVNGYCFKESFNKLFTRPRNGNKIDEAFSDTNSVADGSDTSSSDAASVASIDDGYDDSDSSYADSVVSAFDVKRMETDGVDIVIGDSREDETKGVDIIIGGSAENSTSRGPDIIIGGREIAAKAEIINVSKETDGEIIHLSAAPSRFDVYVEENLKAIREISQETPGEDIQLPKIEPGSPRHRRSRSDVRNHEDQKQPSPDIQDIQHDQVQTQIESAEKIPSAIRAHQARKLQFSEPLDGEESIQLQKQIESVQKIPHAFRSHQNRSDGPDIGSVRSTQNSLQDRNQMQQLAHPPDEEGAQIHQPQVQIPNAHSQNGSVEMQLDAQKQADICVGNAQDPAQKQQLREDFQDDIIQRQESIPPNIQVATAQLPQLHQIQESHLTSLRKVSGNPTLDEESQDLQRTQYQFHQEQDRIPPDAVAQETQLAFQIKHMQPRNDEDFNRRIQLAEQTFTTARQSIQSVIRSKSQKPGDAKNLKQQDRGLEQAEKSPNIVQDASDVQSSERNKNHRNQHSLQDPFNRLERIDLGVQNISQRKRILHPKQNQNQVQLAPDPQLQSHYQLCSDRTHILQPEKHLDFQQQIQFGHHEGDSQFQFTPDQRYLFAQVCIQTALQSQQMEQDYLFWQNPRTALWFLLITIAYTAATGSQKESSLTPGGFGRFGKMVLVA